jgi:hypothetical protein
MLRPSKAVGAGHIHVLGSTRTKVAKITALTERQLHIYKRGKPCNQQLQ